MLNAGDIAIIGFQSDNPDDFAFVALADIAAGETILFTDNGVQADGSFRANEGTLSWTAPADVAAGTVISLLGNAAEFTAAGGSFALATAGDQIVAYQDDGSGPKFIHAVNVNDDAFADDATTSNTSALPPGLTLGETAVAIPEVDNTAYAGTTSGDRAALLAAIADPANWSGGNDAADYPGAAGPFDVDGDSDGNGDGDDTGGNGAGDGVYTLELLHIADQEASFPAVFDAPRASAIFNALEAQDIGEDGIEDNTIRLSSGDAILPGLFFSASEVVYGSAGVADILIQNELGLQSIALGNHEFDLGPEFLAGLINGDANDEFDEDTGELIARGDLDGDGVDDFEGTDFPYLSSNLDFSTEPSLAPLEVPGAQAPQPMTVTSSVILDENGESIGVVGATTPTLPSIASPGGVGVSPDEFGTPPSDAELDALAAIIQAEVDAVLAADPTLNKVILLAHMQQIAIEQALAERLENVDIIVAGGSNTRLVDETDRLRDGDTAQGDYPIVVENAGGTDTLVVNTDGSYKYVGRLVIDFDAQGNVIADSYDPDVSGAYATDAQGVAELGAEGLVDPEIAEIADAIEEVIISNEQNFFGLTDVYLEGRRNEVRTQETNLGNLTADANLAEARKTDPDVVVSIKNGGGIRDDIGEVTVPPGGSDPEFLPPTAVVDEQGNVVKPEGGISQNDIANSLRFNNNLTLLTLTTDELAAVLEHGVAASEFDADGGTNQPGQFPQVAGVEFSFDPAQPAGDRIQNAAIVDDAGGIVAEIVRDGDVVDNGGQTFRIVTLGFLAGGGDDYPFPDGPSADRVDLDADNAGEPGDATFADEGTEQDALAEYIDDNFPTEAEAFMSADTPFEGDERIQNLAFRDDTVFGDTGDGNGDGDGDGDGDGGDGDGGDGDGDAALSVAQLGSVGLSGAEIVDFDPATDRAFVTSEDGIIVVDAADPNTPVQEATLDPTDDGADEASVTSVTVSGGLLAAAVPGDDEQAPGQVFFYDTTSLAFLGAVTVGALPDMVTFDETGDFVLVANEGEADDGVDPEGSVSVIAVDRADPGASTVTTVGFDDTVTLQALADKGVRVFPDAASAAQDLEPEYITVEGTTAFVALQEANAVAVIDDITAPGDFSIDDIQPLGAKDHSVEGAGLDPSNEDDGINIAPQPVQGLYMPDGLASFTSGGQTYYVTANEGDARDEDADIEDLTLDPTAFPDAATLQQEENLGALEASTIDGDTDGDGDYDELFVYGGRSFSIRDADGNLVFDSGDAFEQITAEQTPELFNADDGDPDEFDQRSDNKGPEPEAVTYGEVDGTPYVFVGLERAGGGVLAWDVTDPTAPIFASYFRDDADIAPEGLEFISAEDSPTGQALLAVANEVSATLTFYQLGEGDDGTGGGDFTLISEVQGATDFSGLSEPAVIGVEDVSPLLGETVTIEAVVTADFQDGAAGTPGNDLNGFFVQEEDADADGDDATSEGLFVFDGSMPDVDVAVGDLVQVTGEVGEFFGKTQISADDVAIVSSGNSLPGAAQVTFPTTGIMATGDGEFVADLESVEGMLANVPTEMTVTELFNLDRFGEYVVSSGGRLFQYTQLNDPDADGLEDWLQMNASRSVVLDDGQSVQNPDPIEVIDGDNGVLDAGDEFRMGDTITGIEGVVDYGFGEFRVQDPTGTYDRQNPRPESPADPGGDLQVASFNVLNYFTTIDTGGENAGPDDDQEPRGADSPEELERQATKLVNAILEIDADILGLIEIENDDDEAIADLVDRVNAEAGAGTYDFIATGDAGSDAITNGIIYKPGSVAPLGDVDVLTEFEGQDFLDPLDSPREGLNRPAITQTFADLETGEAVTVSVNHFKSKGSLSGLPQDEAQGDGQGNNNATRDAAAAILAEYLASDPTGQGAEKVLAIGDFNSYAQEDPIRTLEAAGYTDVAQALLGEDAYSFVFSAQAGTLDYILANDAAFDHVTGVTEWHINADEPDAFDYNLDFGRDPALFDPDSAARNSDHDPVIVGLELGPDQVAEGDGKLDGTRRDDLLVGGDEDDKILLRFGDDVAEGNGGADHFIVDSRYVTEGDTHLIRDLTFGEGDSLQFRFFGLPGNGKVESEEELQSLIDAGVVTVLATDATTGALTLRLSDFDDGIGDSQSFIGTLADDLFDGGSGGDHFLLRFGSDTATGGADADMFVLDNRYVEDGDSHTITDLDFGQGDELRLRFFEAGSSEKIDSLADLAAIDALDFATLTQSGDDALLDLTDRQGDTLSLLLEDVYAIA